MSDLKTLNTKVSFLASRDPFVIDEHACLNKKYDVQFLGRREPKI